MPLTSGEEQTPTPSKRPGNGCFWKQDTEVPWFPGAL